MNNGLRWWYKERSRLDRAMDDIKVAAMLAVIVLLAMAVGALLMAGVIMVKQILQWTM